MDYLVQQNRKISGDPPDVIPITAEGKHVVVLGGGDTSSDCIGNAARERAGKILNFIKYPKPPEQRPEDQPWPYWPNRLRTTSSHEEGCERHWGLMAKEFKGSRGRVETVVTIDMAYSPAPDGGKPIGHEIPGSLRHWPADLVLLAIGFEGTETDTLVTQLGLELDRKSNIQTDERYMTDNPGVFSAGDANMGASLIVWAISEGREAAREVDLFLMGKTVLPTKGPGDMLRL
jgi:glutamate synthase (NADPH/NADH) small chain